MEEAVKDGKLRSIGISNYYTKEAVDEVLSFATITPAVIQNENHIYYQNTELQEYVKQYGIVVESWYPFGGRGHTSENFNNEVIMDLAGKYDKSSAQIILRWQLQSGFIAIPGSSNQDHITENYDIFDFELTDEDMQRIRNLDRHELIMGIDVKRYMIVLDHQPNDYAAESAAGVDLVLSGHTHGGQLIPISYVGEWLGANDRTYGREKRGTTEFIVTSGISDWAIGFKTGTKSEYVVLNLLGETN